MTSLSHPASPPPLLLLPPHNETDSEFETPLRPVPNATDPKLYQPIRRRRLAVTAHRHQEYMTCARRLVFKDKQMSPTTTDTLDSPAAQTDPESASGASPEDEDEEQPGSEKSVL